jgi:hypothetical protein
MVSKTNGTINYPQDDNAAAVYVWSIESKRQVLLSFTAYVSYTAYGSGRVGFCKTPNELGLHNQLM